MYGDGTKKPAVENPGTPVGNEPHPAESHTEGAATQSLGTATSDLEPPARPQAQEGISSASIKSGVVGHNPEESRLMSETTDQTSGAAFTRGSGSYPSGAQSTDFATRSNPQTDPHLTQSRGAEPVSAGETSTHRSNPFHKSDNAPIHIDRESQDPTPHRQQEHLKSSIRGAGDGSKSTRAVADHSQPGRDENAYASERGFTGAGGMTTGRRNEPTSRESLPVQYSKADPNNPYSASRLDPRVDPHAKPSTSVVSGNDTMNRPNEYGSSTDNQGLSGTKTTAEPFDGAKGNSQTLHGPKGTAERFDGPKGTSEPLQSSTGISEPRQGLEGSSWPLKEDQPHSRVEVMPGAFDSEAFVTEISRDPVPESKASYYDFGSSIAGGATTEATQGPKDSSKPLIEETKYLSGAGAVPGASMPGVYGGESTTSDPSSQTATASYGIASSPFAADTPESTQGPKSTAGPLDSSRDPSWPLREQGTDQHQTSAGAPLGTSGLSDYASGHRSDYPARGAEASSYGVGSSQGIGSVSERSQPTYSGIDTSHTNDATDESHKGRNAGILGATAGALGLGGYAAKKHGEDKPDRPTAGNRQEPISTTDYPPGTSLDDKYHPEAPVEGYGAIPSRGQDNNEAPYTGGTSQVFDRTGTTATQPVVGASGTTGSSTATSSYAVGDRQEESHMGRNTALGGAAAAGAGALGAHEHSRHQAQKPSTATSDYTSRHELGQHQHSKDEPDERRYGRDAAVGGIAQPTSTHGYPQQQFEKLSAVSSDYASKDKPDERHHGRDAAIGGGALAAGVGAVGAHEYSRHQSEKPLTAASEYTARDLPEERYRGGHAAIGDAATAGPRIVGTPEHSRRQAEKSSTGIPGSTTGERPQESHIGRNAAIGGVAAAGAGAVGAHEYSQHKAEIEAQQRVEAEKAHQKALEESRKAAEKEQRAHEKALAKEEKEHEKALQKEEKKAEKEHEKAVHKEEKKVEKEHEKLVKKEEREHEKAIQKEEKEHQKEHEAAIKLEEKKQKEHEKELARQQKEAEKQRDSEEKEKKHGGLLGLFRRRKDSKGNDVEDEDDHTGVKTSTSATDEDSHEYGKRHIFGLPHHEVKHKLHKDPPPGLYSGDSATPAYADYAIKENNHPGAQTVTGGYTTPDPEHDRNKYPGAAGPGSGHGAGTDVLPDRSRGTGTTALAQGDRETPTGGVAYQATGGTNITSSTEAGRSIPPRDNSDPMTRIGPGEGRRGSTGVKYGDLPEGYASQVTGGIGTTRLAGEKQSGL